MEQDLNNLTLAEGDRQELIRWAVACVERLLPVFAAERPEDTRLNDALNGARRFSAGQLNVGPMRKLERVSDMLVEARGILDRWVLGAGLRR